MKIYRKDGSEFIENGVAKIRVAEFNRLPSPITNGRIVKIMAVQEVLSSSPTNPIAPENIVCLSFPEEHVNAKKYEWKKGEECTLPYKINLT